jgi:hypothetical protein
LVESVAWILDQPVGGVVPFVEAKSSLSTYVCEKKGKYGINKKSRKSVLENKYFMFLKNLKK